jgi:AcrR family transcriptional regulator
VARPRSITDQAILKEAYNLIMEQGPNSLTFERLGERVGLVAAALVRRFKTKSQLLLEVDRYALQLTNEQVDQAMSQASSPIEAILAQFITELRFASSVERFANGQEFLLMDFRDKNLYINYKTSFEHRHQQIIELLQEAQLNDELEGIENVAELARHLEMILHGSGHVWAMTQEDPIEHYISRHVNIALAPYRKTKKK